MDSLAEAEKRKQAATDAVAVAAKLGYFPPAAPYAFWMMTVAFAMLVLGSLLKGL